jgi:imidazolonepropionase-like amidohydrolase
VADVVAGFRRAGVIVVPTLTAWKTQVRGVSELARTMDEDLRDPSIVTLVPARLAVEWRLDLAGKKERSAEAQEAWSGFYRQLVEDLRALHRGGVPLAAGSDVGVEGVVPGRSLFQELCALETEIGVDPMQLLRTSTVTASRVAGHGETTGTIAPGKSADLLLLMEDPRTSTRALASLVHVVLRGTPITVREADRALLTSACPR